MKIDINELVPGCKNFTWGELLYLPQWGVCAFPSIQQHSNLIDVAKKLQLIRDYLEQPIKITSGLRPVKYNELIGGARMSQHRLGAAADFQVKGIKADRVRAILRLVIDDFEIRVEDLKGSNWVHIDLSWSDTGNNYFKP